MHLNQNIPRSMFSMSRIGAEPEIIQPESHPLQVQQQSATKLALEHNTRSMSNLFGTGFALNAQMDMAVLSKVQRHPGLRSSNIALETYLNLDCTVDVGDYLNAPEFNEQMVDGRGLLEKQYGLI